MEQPTSTSSPSDSLVRVVTSHVVSASSMVSRAYLTDSWRAIIVSTGGGENPWLAATLDAFGPDTDELLARGYAKGGPPPEHAGAALVKVTVAWGDVAGLPGPGGERHIPNPKVVKHPGGASIAVLPLVKVQGFGSEVRGESGPVPLPLTLDDTDPLPIVDDDEFDVLTLFRPDEGPYWPITRRSRRVSEVGGDFLGQPGAVGLDLRLEPFDAGSPAQSSGGSSPVFRGMVRAVGPELAMLLPSRLIVETIVHARAENRSG